MHTNQVVIKDVPWGNSNDHYVVYSMDAISEDRVKSFLNQPHVHGCDDYVFFANMLATYLNLDRHDSHDSVGEIISSQIRTVVVKDLDEHDPTHFTLDYDDSTDRWILI